MWVLMVLVLPAMLAGLELSAWRFWLARVLPPIARHGAAPLMVLMLHLKVADTASAGLPGWRSRTGEREG